MSAVSPRVPARAARRLPGPKAPPIIGSALEYGVDPLAALLRWARQYGNIFRVRLGPLAMVFLNHPDDIEAVLLAKNPPLPKATDRFPQREFVRAIFGNGLVFSEGEFWKRQRRLAAPAFHHQRIAAYGETMVRYTTRRLDQWRPGEIRDVHAEMMQITLEIVAKTLFDSDVGRDAPKVGAAFGLVMDEMARRMNTLVQLPLKLPTPGNRRVRDAVRRLDELLVSIAHQRRVSGEDRGDLLSMLIHARDDNGQQMSDRQLRDEVITLVLAGHETTAVTLSWAVYLLARHPTIEARLVEELQAVLGGRAPTVADVPRLRYTEQVIKETLRLYPPTPLIAPRLAPPNCEFQGYALPPGALLALSPYIVHHDPRYYPVPERFDPERWTPERTAALPRFAFFPFSGGPRVCIGSAFAMMEATLLLATIAQRFRLALVPERPVEPQISMTLRPKHGLHMRLAAR